MFYVGISATSYRYVAINKRAHCHGVSESFVASAHVALTRSVRRQVSQPNLQYGWSFLA